LIRLRALKDKVELARLRSFARDKGHRIRGRGRGRGGMAQLVPPRSPAPAPYAGAPCFTCGEPGCRPGICNSMHPNARYHHDQVQSKVQPQGDLNTSGHSLAIPQRLPQLGQRLAHIDQDHELSLRLGNSCDWEDEYLISVFSICVFFSRAILKSSRSLFARLSLSAAFSIREPF